jgi:glycosyltransferase involved in cell wall biosynthesis
MPDHASRAPEFTILMPCLDEAEGIGYCIDAAQAFLDRERIDGEIVVADNGSTDGSIDIALARGARVVRVAERGYGAALQGGIRAARGTFVIAGDADGSYDFAHLEPFVAALRGGADLVVGNRFKGGIEQGAMPFLHRWLGNPVLSFLGRLFFTIPIGDFHCGLRGFRRDRVLALGLRAPGMEFASEIIVRGALGDLALAEVPTRLHPDRRSRPSHLRTWRDGWRHLRFLLLLSPRWLFLYPGAILFGAGFIAQAILFAGPVRVGRVVLDIHTMLFAGGATIVGLQTMLFAAFVKAAGVAQGLLPPGRAYESLVARFTLERGALVGAATMLAGIGLAGWSLSVWMSAGLADIDPRRVMRIVIPSLTLTIAGIELVFSSFVLHFLLWNRGDRAT